MLNMTDKNEKINFYFNEKFTVHIDCYNSRFYNGEIIEINSKKGFLILKDRVLGEMPIMFEEIQNIEPMREVLE